MNKLFQPPVSTSGRPTKERAEKRHEHLLDQALEMFLEKGFELTTIDAIAASLGMTKRTIYSRYKDKRALFRAVVQRAVDRWVLPLEVFEAADTGNLEATLMDIAHIRVTNSLSPAGIRLQRIINAESFRFPEIFESFEKGGRPGIDFLAELFKRHEGRELRKMDDPFFYAVMFSTVIASAGRLVVWGRPVDQKAIRKSTEQCVRLFLDGLRAR
jgi:AcrR family transcriptional regulator